MLELTICDPACGSGAFLNQALEYLINEHHYIDGLNAQLFGSAMVFQDVENQILEKNIFGVDINEESVDIARLSLWLRTAQRGRKLTTLNKNIKCGNSLIDDPEVARDKAFNWEKEFPEVFVKGGFDVVIGNPPYVRQELLGEFKPYFESNYKVYEGTTDLFAYFYEKSFQILVSGGLFGFISNTFDKTKAATKLRSYLTNNTDFINYIDFTEVQIFEGATTYPVIIVAKNSTVNESNFKYIKIPKSSQSKIINIDSEVSVKVDQNSLKSGSWSFNSVQMSAIHKKMNQHQTIRDQFGKCFRGIVTGFNDAFIIDNQTKEALEEEHFSSQELIKPFYEGKDLSKWHTVKIEKYLIFTRRGTDIDNYPAIKRYLESFKERLTPRNSPEIKTGRKPGPYKWFEIQDSIDYFKVFESKKITWPNLQSKNKFCLENDKYYINAPSVVFPSNNKILLCILNSRLIWFFLKSICVIRSGGYIEVKPQYFEQIPIPELKNEDAFIQKAGGEKLSKMDEMEWMGVFETKKAEAQTLKAEIDATNKEIDRMVYELYNLTEEEIQIVEKS